MLGYKGYKIVARDAPWRLYPQVGRNLVMNREHIVVGAVAALRRAARLLVGTSFAVMWPPRRQGLRERLERLLVLLGGLLTIVAVHTLPNRWRRVVLWWRPNVGELGLAPHYLLRWLDRHPELDIRQYVLVTSPGHNRTLVEMVGRRVRVIESKFLHKWFQPPFNTARASIFWANYGPFGEFEDDLPHLSFTRSEEVDGEQLLRRMGIEVGQPFICVHWRDHAFYDAVDPVQSRVTALRNTTLQEMLPTLKYLAGLGTPVLRMGALVKDPLPDDLLRAYPSVIDYARLFRTDLGDIYLTAKCKLYVGTNAGLFSVPQAFNRPLVMVDYNFPQVMNLLTSNALVIFRKCRFQDNRREMCYPEMMVRWPWYWDDQRLGMAGIEAVPTTADEILAAVQERLELLEGIDRSTDEDRELQRRFWAMFPPENVNGQKLPRIGREFLRQHKHLLT